MERKPTRPSPVPGTSKKKKSDLSLTSSRQAVDLTDVSQNLRVDDGGKTDNTEKEKAARLESPDLVWLEENATDYLDQKERNHESVQQPYPFHPSETLRVLIPEAEVGPRYCKGPVGRCPVGCTTETAHSILPKLTQNTSQSTSQEHPWSTSTSQEHPWPMQMRPLSTHEGEPHPQEFLPNVFDLRSLWLLSMDGQPR